MNRSGFLSETLRMNNNLCQILILLITVLTASIFKRWALSILVIIPVMAMASTELVQGLCIALLVTMICLDGKYHRDNSVFYKYNIFCSRNKLPKFVVLILLLLSVVVALLSIIFALKNIGWLQ